MNLLDDDSLYPILKKQILDLDYYRFEVFSKEIVTFQEIRPELATTLEKLHEDLKLDHFLTSLIINLKDSNFKLIPFVLDLNDLIFGKSEFHNNERFFENLCQNIKSQITWQTTPVEIYNIFNKSIAELFIIDYTESLFTYNFNSVIASRKINLNALALLYLMVAERIDLPIFGMPVYDKLLLCLTKEHCYHNEMVYEDDIIFYFTPSDNGVVYTVEDLEFIAEKNDLSLDLNSKLPKGNNSIVAHWLFQIEILQQSPKTSQKLSIYFQQILELLKNTE